MAFLCPIRIRHKKSKNNSNSKLPPIIQSEENSQVVGRVTGSSSIETLVRVGVEKESTHTVLHDFTPCVDDELLVKRGDIVTLLYREHDWAYVLSSENKEGFIPFSYLELRETPSPVATTSTTNSTTPEIKPAQEETFSKDTALPYVTLYTFHACNENDLTVHRGELLTVLNKDDPDWFWVCNHANQEGFVPSAFVFPCNYVKEAKKSAKRAVQQQQQESLIRSKDSSSSNTNSNNNSKGTELVMLYDYKAQASDDLSVKRGDWVYADLQGQTVEGWLWAWNPRQRKYGFLPKAYARTPAMTSL